MGLFDDMFGNFFDFNNDGKTTLDEKFLAYKIYEEVNKEDKNENVNNTNDSMRFYSTDEDYTDKYGWRALYSNDSEYNVFPKDYETELEYKEALEKAKTAWRNKCQDAGNSGISPKDYETEGEYIKALNETKNKMIIDLPATVSVPIELTFPVEWPSVSKPDTIKKSDYANKLKNDAEYTVSNETVIYSDKKDEPQKKEMTVCVKETELHNKKHVRQGDYNKEDCAGLNSSDYEKQPINSGHNILDDKNIYTYCGVVFHKGGCVYHYRTNDNTIKMGDYVIVPIGNDMKENKAKIVSVGQYYRMSVPFPLEKTRFILRKVDEN